MEAVALSPRSQAYTERWLNIIRSCRASGMPVATWCRQNDVHIKSYYYWLAKFRKQALAEVHDSDPNKTSKTESRFVELSVPTSEKPTVPVILKYKNIQIEIPETTSPDFITTLVRAVSQC